MHHISHQSCPKPFVSYDQTSLKCPPRILECINRTRKPTRLKARSRTRSEAKVPSENAPNNLKEAPVAVIRGDLKIRKMTRLAEIKITDSEQLDSFIAEEQNRKEKIVNPYLKAAQDSFYAAEKWIEISTQPYQF